MAEQQTPAEQASDLLRPIRNLINGDDGGFAYARLHHELLPAIVAKAEGGHANFVRYLEAFKLISGLCEGILMINALDALDPE